MVKPGQRGRCEPSNPKASRIKPRHTYRDGIWQIYVREVNDGFVSRDHVRRVASDDDLYRLTLADYSAVMAGRDGKFQWVGVSNVA